MRLRDIILDLLFPPRCSVCGRVAPYNQVFCPECRQRLIESRSARTPTGEDGGFSACVFAANYGEETRHAVIRLKEIPDSNEARVFADMLCDAIADAMPDRHFDAVVPVPMTKSKMKMRRHNQAETLARHVAEHLSVPCLPDVLLRHDGMATQHMLGREARHENAAAAYDAVPGASVRGDILLVDDVMTTGATADRCAQLLRSIGAQDVVAATAAAVPAKNSAEQSAI
jgi:competence protein ComFC